MSYSFEQAEEAIFRKRLTDAVNKLRIMQHNMCVSDVAVYNLPYRVLWDYEQAERDPMEIKINPFYPLPSAPRKALLTAEESTNRIKARYSPNEWIALTTVTAESRAHVLELLGLQEDEACLEFIDEPVNDELVLKEYRAEERRINDMAAERLNQYKPWDLSSPQGLKAWECSFTRFIVPYKDDIPTWSAFDFWGNTEHTTEETEQKRKYYMRLIKDYEKHPDRYDTQPHYKQLRDYDLYDVSMYMWHDGHVPPEHPQALQIMYKEREQELRHLESTGAFKYEIEHPNRFSTLYRINEIISRLEHEQEVKQ